VIGRLRAAGPDHARGAGAGRALAALRARVRAAARLLERPGAILSREQLENRIYGWGEEVSSNAVDVLIHGMRRKLGADAIRNVRGLGWRVVA
jgi:DNA-binding response OmpR family regulator